VDLLGERGGESEGRVLVKIELTKSEYEALKAIARREGYSLVSEYLRDIIRGVVEGRIGKSVSGGEQVDALARRLERVIVDILNPYTGKIDEITRRLAELRELLEEAREERVREVVERPVRRAPAIEKLKEQGVVFQEDVRWMKSPERFFEKLKREGAMVLSIGGERVALDPGFWARFAEEVDKISVGDVEEAASLLEMSLGEAAGRLFRKMVKAGVAVYDEDQGIWVLNVQK
jgi:hypothetical protein